MNKISLARLFRILFVLIIFAAVVFSLLAVFNNISTSTINITIESQASPIETSVMVDDKKAYLVGSGANKYRVEVGSGSHDIQVSAAGYNTGTANIKTGLKGQEHNLTIKLTKSTAENIVASVTQDQSDIKIVDPTLFGNDWLVFSRTYTSIKSEKSLVVMKYSDDEDKWVTVTEGTSFDSNSPSLSGAPAELLLYLEDL